MSVGSHGTKHTFEALCFIQGPKAKDYKVEEEDRDASSKTPPPALAAAATTTTIKQK